MNEPVFYDIEASGLHGVPIEIGWVVVEGNGEVAGEKISGTTLCAL